MSGRSRASLSLLVSAALLLTGLLAGPVAAASPTVTVVASGLDNPRGIAIGRNGRVVVAEAGRGGDGADGYGTTGKIIEIRSGRVRTLASGLPSIIAPDDPQEPAPFREVSGPVGVALTGSGNLFTAVGGGPQDINKRFNTVLRVRPRPGRVMADIQASQNHDPDPTDIDQPPNPFDSNPYGIAAIGNSRILVTDAGNNDLLLVKANRRVTTVARFPNELVSTDSLPTAPGLPPHGITIPAEAVPTAVAIGPDGYWYVGELKGFPFTPGTSRIWRIAPWARNVTCDPTATSGPCTLYMDGFTSIVGLAWRGHSLYVVEMVKSGVFNAFIGADDVGALWKVTNGVKTELVPGQLTLPGGVAVARNGTIYVTNQSVSIGGGEVLRITP